MSENLLTLTIDGHEVKASADSSIIQAYARSGNAITANVGCMGQGVCGSCRCMIRKEGEREVTTALACETKVEEVLYFLYPPEIKQTPNATALAKEHLAAMGPMKREEKIMLGIFLVLLLLWAGIPEMLFGVKVDATATTFLGLSLCLLTGVLTWDDALKEKSAWDTIVWFAALVMMANFLNKLGLISWLSDSMQSGIAHMGLGWEAGCALLMLAYLYAHYVFASGTAHVTAMFGAFYGAGLALGAPPMLFALVMAAATGIMMSLTHYATGSAPVIYGSNYVTMTEWWKAGFIMSVVEILIFSTVGILWWKALGYW